MAQPTRRSQVAMGRDPNSLHVMHEVITSTIFLEEEEELYCLFLVENRKFIFCLGCKTKFKNQNQVSITLHTSKTQCNK